MMPSLTRLLAACFVLALTGSVGCVEPYVPAVLNAPTKILVVDGFINGNGRSIFKLSRTANLAATATPAVEKGARVAIADETGRQYSLAELAGASGTYRSDSLLLAPNHQYQVRIATAGVNYASDLVPLKVTPLIGKLNWKLAGDQVQVQLSTRDPAAQTRYYRWSYIETWQFTAAYVSRLEYFPHPLPGHSNIGLRTTPIYTCWRTERPTTIKQSTTAQLSQDALTDYGLFTVPANAERVKIRYSVLVRQYAQTAEEFAYYELLRKNTEAVGTVNDPLPSQLTGNVHRVDVAGEPVLGYVGAHTVQQQRLFIDRSELPFRNDWEYDSPYKACTASNLYFCDKNGCDYEGIVRILSQPDNVVLNDIGDPDFGLGYSAATVECADCRTRGSSTKPSFW